MIHARSGAEPDWHGRLRTLETQLGGLSLSGLIVSSLHNIRYLTGFDGSAGLLIVQPGSTLLLIDGRYETVARAAQAAGQLAAGVELRRIPSRYDPALIDALKIDALKAAGIPRMGVEANHLTLATFHLWRDGVGSAVSLEATSGLVERQRLVKDEHEIRILRDAARRLSDVAMSLRPILGIGRTEREVAGDIDERIRQAGFSKPAFDTIVASGPNGAYPHARPTDRAMQAGDLVVLDFGGVLDGYCVDLTRAAGLGRVGAEAESLYRAVREAQDAAIGAVHPGIRTVAVDAAAREVLKAQGFGERFVHGTGHGLGLEVHEAPHVSSDSAGGGEPLEAGMVITIEPGAYVEGLGGVRLEDDVLVTQDGREVLTTAPRDLLAV